MDRLNPLGRRGAVFLDRDGVINHDSPSYIKSVEEWCPIDGSLDAIRRLHQAGERVVVVTNQSALARGLVSERTLAAIHAEMVRLVEEAGGRIAGIHVCPHAPDAGCRCRKPGPGLLEAAAEGLGLSPAGIAFVGDKVSDLGAGRAAGCTPIFVASGQGRAADLEGAEWAEVPRFRDLAAYVDARLAAFGSDSD